MIIAISGKIGSGKDTVGQIIQYLVCLNNNSLAEHQKDFKYFQTAQISNEFQSGWKIKKFAGKLKQIVSILTGVPVEDLEKEEVKNKSLPEAWRKKYHLVNKEKTHSIEGESAMVIDTLPTYRWLLQTIGTEAMRQNVHENVWVNALFADRMSDNSNWIISDMRFKNEKETVEKFDGITIRVNRNWVPVGIGIERLANGEKNPNEHPSETALDDATFKYVINNNGTIEELIEKVKEILILEKIITI